MVHTAASETWRPRIRRIKMPMPMPSSEQGGTHRNHGELRRIDVAEGQRIGQRERSVLGKHVHDAEDGQSEPLPLPKESHRPMASEAITVDSGRMIHRKRIENPIAPAPSVKHQNTNSVSIQTARYARGAASSVGRCRGSVLLSGVVAHLVPANKKKPMIKRS